MKIIAGAAMTSKEGWYSTNEKWLDITQVKDWQRVFNGKALLTHVLAEHVFEHLTEDETRIALGLFHAHMVSGGRIRIAVPDGYHPDPTYIRHVGIAGIGADAADHKQLLNCDTLARLLRDAGFATEFLEGYRSNGELVTCVINPAFGNVIRSRCNTATMAGRSGWLFPDADTSLVIDGIKST